MVFLVPITLEVLNWDILENFSVAVVVINYGMPG